MRVTLVVRLGLLLWLLALVLAPSRAQAPAAPACPRCGMEMVLPPATAEPQGEGDDQLCRWDLQARNPYRSLFAYCPRCGFTILREHLPRAAALHAATAQSALERVTEDPLQVVHLAHNVRVIYSTDAVPEPDRLKALWVALCALHRAPLPYPEAAWNQEVNQVWKRMRTWGLQEYPVWRWYEALGHYFQMRWHRTGVPRDGLLALDFFRRIGRTVQVNRLRSQLARHDLAPELRQWLDWQVQFQETAAHIADLLFVRETTTVNRCQPPWIALLMVRFTHMAYTDQPEETRATLATLRSCPVPDPILYATYLAPALRRVWTLRPAWRSWLNAWLDWNPYAPAARETSAR